MFCPSCGAEAAEGLSYCKRCGAKLGAAQKGDSRPKVAGLVWAISVALALVTLGGFAVVFGFLIEHGTRASNFMLGLLGLLLLVVLAVDYLLARQLSRLLSFHLRGQDGARAEQLSSDARPPAEIEAPRRPNTAELEQPRRTLADLEQPTRTLGELEQATRTLDTEAKDSEPR